MASQLHAAPKQSRIPLWVGPDGLRRSHRMVTDRRDSKAVNNRRSNILITYRYAFAGRIVLHIKKNLWIATKNPKQEPITIKS